MRLNKFLAQKGLCSRREADKLITNELVRVNNEKVNPGYILEEGNEVTVLEKGSEKTHSFIFSENKSNDNFENIYIALNKPVDIECTCNTDIKGNIITYLRKNKKFLDLEKEYQQKNSSLLRLFHIGRLDKNSHGLILLSNDGELSQKLMHPSFEHEKEYLVTVNKELTEDFIKKLSAGVTISRDKKEDKVKTLPCKVKQVSKNSFNIILKQGYKRQIRKSCKVLGYEVEDLYRFRIGEVNIGKNHRIKESDFLILNKKMIDF
ncbi:MAG: rRNA pseudouridine synthase [Candidatus Caenarcaniphilales bacterium]|nr:rRNA pseudouridine synthase [Candidatus Caenarcaniphilales bacterium]